MVYSISSAVGQNFIYYTITEFNPLVLTTVTTTRKIFTTLYSVFRNPANSLTNGQWAGCSLVFGGMILDIVASALWPKKKGGGAAAGADVELGAKSSLLADERFGGSIEQEELPELSSGGPGDRFKARLDELERQTQAKGLGRV